jgi:hypothetical protein
MSLVFILDIRDRELSFMGTTTADCCAIKFI